MTSEDELRELLSEIRDNQRLAIQHQMEQIALLREHHALAKKQITDSMNLQKQAMSRFKALSMLVLPAIAVCLALVLYLIVRYL
jgi:hypothetical protein